MEVRDYYQTLGVPRTASQADIKKAFRKLARTHHPDAKPGDKAAEQRFKDVNEANEVLSDPEKRAKYDRFGRDWEAYERAASGRGGGGRGGAGGPDPFGPGSPFAGFAGFGGGSGAAGAGPGGIRYEFRSSGAESGQFSDFFSMLFGQGAGPGGAGGAEALARERSAASRVFPPIEAHAEVSLEESFHGCARVVDLGDGRRLEVSLPRGVDTGSRVRVAGKGPDGRDLVVVVRVHPHGVFTRRGADLERELPVTLEEALLGAETPVRTLKGRVLLTVPAGTQNGRTFRLSGQGMPRLKGGDPGDLYVKVRVVLPTHLSDEAKAAAARFLELADQPDPRA